MSKVVSLAAERTRRREWLDHDRCEVCWRRSMDDVAFFPDSPLVYLQVCEECEECELATRDPDDPEPAP